MKERKRYITNKELIKNLKRNNLYDHELTIPKKPKVSNCCHLKNNQNHYYKYREME